MHDLRSPIKNIKTLTDMMRQECPENEWLDMIDECGVQASEIFEDFLDFIKETPAKKLPVDLCKVIEDGIKLTEQGNTNEQVAVYKNITGNITLQGDESKLKRCIMNLVNNAMEVLIEHKIINPRIDILAEVDKSTNHAVITVRDNGLGIPNEIIKTLFDPFVTKKKANGTGLGLAIVKQYIIAHGGEINVANDKGAVFTITLPMQQ